MYIAMHTKLSSVTIQYIAIQLKTTITFVRERFTYQSYYKKTQDVAGLKLERKQSKKTGSYNPGLEMNKKLNIFLPYSDMTQIDDVIPTGDRNTVYNDLYDENIEDDFLK